MIRPHPGVEQKKRSWYATPPPSVRMGTPCPMVRPRIEFETASPSPKSDGPSSRVAAVGADECVRRGGVPPAQAAGGSSGSSPPMAPPRSREPSAKPGGGGIVLRRRDEERAVRLVVGLIVVRLDSIALIAVICVFGRASEFTLDAANAGLMIGPLSVRRSAAGVAT